MWVSYLRHEYECLWQEAAEYDGESSECKWRVLLLGHEQRDGGGDDAQHSNVIDAHADLR